MEKREWNAEKLLYAAAFITMWLMTVILMFKA